MPRRHLQSLAAPDAAHPVLAHPKATPVEHGGNAPVAVAPILTRQRDDALREQILIGPLDEVIALGAPRLTQKAAGSALRDPVLVYRLIHRPPTSLGA